MLFKWHNKTSPLNSTHYAKLYPQNGDRIVAINSVTSFHPVYRPNVPSVLWCCWLGGRKGIRPVKNFEWWGAGVIICLERDADMHMAQMMPLPLTVSCFSKIQIGFTFLVPAHLGSLVPEKGPLNGVCIYRLNSWEVAESDSLSPTFASFSSC